MSTIPSLRQTTTPAIPDERPLAEFGLAVRRGDRWHDLRDDPDWRVIWHPADGDAREVHLSRVDGAPVGKLDLQVTVSLPLLNYGGVVVPDCGRHYVNTPKALDIRSPLFQITAANAGHPFFAVNDEAGALLAAIGILTLPGAAVIRRLLPVISNRKAMVGGDQLLKLAFEWTWHDHHARKVEIGMYANYTAGHWFKALRGYTDLIRQREEVVYPRNPAAWEPVWCTWTAFPSAHMNEQRVLENARLARDMGMGAIILDDGWFGPGLDDDGPRAINHGDYDADPLKFPDLPRLIRRVQDMGLKFLLWHAPLCVAPTSNAHHRLSHWFMRDAAGDFLSVNGLHQLCPACPQVRQYVRQETRRLLLNYGADGLKVDLFNCLSPQPCQSNSHEHDIDDPIAALDALMAAQWDAARSVRPDALVELKQDYGNVRLIRHGSMVRAGDTAYDADTNLLRCAYTQAFAECVHVDPLVTSIHTRPQAMAMLMIKAITGGVPTFSMNLPDLSEAQRDVLAAWLKFYNRHRTMFQARRKPQGQRLDVWQGGGAERAWVSAVGAAAEVQLPQAPTVHLLNATGRAGLYAVVERQATVSVKVRDWNLELIGEQRLTLSSGVQLPVVPGGMTEILTP